MLNSYFIKLKKLPLEVFYKNAVLKNFAILMGKHHLWNSETSTIWIIFCIRLLLNWFYEVIVWNLVSRLHLKPSWLLILQKYQSLSNQSFKQNLGHIYAAYISLNPTLSCERRFHFVSPLTVTTQKANACSPWTLC